MMSNLVNREHSLYDNNLSFWCLSFSTWSVQFSSVAQSCLTLCDPMDAACQTSLSITNSQSLLRLLHIESVGDVIQPSHPLSSPSPPAFNLFQHQCFFLKRVSSLHQVAKVLEFKLQHQSFQWIFRTWFLLGWTGLISLQSKGLSRVFSNTTWLQSPSEVTGEPKK